jgi:hypothetical protein
VVDYADVFGLAGECGEFVAGPVVVVVGHCVGEAVDDCSSQIWKNSQDLKKFSPSDLKAYLYSLAE